MIRKTVGNFDVHFFNSFTHEAKVFEDAIRFSKSPLIKATDNLNVKHDIYWPQLSFWNSYFYAEEQEKPFYGMQFFNKKNDIRLQLIVYVEGSRLASFKQGVIKQWAIPFYYLSNEHLILIIKTLYEFLKEHTDLMSLKVQPYLPGKEYIQSLKPLFYKLGFKADFTDTPEQTRFVDLRPSTEDILKGFASRARAKFIIKNPDEIDICKIQNNLAIPGMQEALDHAFLRSINKKCPFRFEPFLKLFNKNSKIISIFGFYFKDDLINPKAFVTGINHGPIIEYSTGGSLSDQRLRKFQFNNILFWKLIEEAKKNECDFFDLGGISSGASDDPTAGVAQFKRHYPGFELAVGFGMQKTIRPLKFKIFQIIKFCVSRLGYT